MVLVGKCNKCGSELHCDGRRWTNKHRPAFIYCKICDSIISYKELINE